MNTGKHWQSPSSDHMRPLFDQATMQSHTRRATWRRRRRLHLLRLRLFLMPALTGLALLVYEVTQDTPSYIGVGIGMALVVPLLVEAFNE